MAEALKAYITGASRGIGEETAETLAARGWDVAIGYHNSERKARAIVARLDKMGSNAVAIGGDLTSLANRARIIAEVSEWAPRLGALVLNAAGGMEEEKADDPYYPLAINRDAPVALAKGLMPNLKNGGKAVYLQSFAGSLHGQIESPSETYNERVAGPKRAGEDALRELIPELEENGSGLVVVTGGIVEGTAVGRMYLGDEKTAETHRRIDNVVRKSAMAEAVADAITNPVWRSGDVIVVGAPLERHLEGDQ
jgi:3-oxoacyl-[acyl-carrier protein] reductase